MQLSFIKINCYTWECHYGVTTEVWTSSFTRPSFHVILFYLCDAISLKNQGLISKIIFLRDTETMGKDNTVTWYFMSLTIIWRVLKSKKNTQLQSKSCNFLLALWIFKWSLTLIHQPNLYISFEIYFNERQIAWNV